MGRDPLSGDRYLFVNQACRVAKVLFWDGCGLVVMHKRILTGRFAAPWKRSVDGTSDSRSNEAADRILTGFKGTLLTDAFAVHESRAKALDFNNAIDWSHARSRHRRHRPRRRARSSTTSGSSS
jgi:hypothetical protein